MQIGVVVNDSSTLVPTQTTAMFVHALAQMGETHVMGVAELGVDSDGRIFGHTRQASPSTTVKEAVDALTLAPAKAVKLDSFDAVLIRTNPARDRRGWAHEGALELLSMLADRGIRVVNDPDGLQRAGSKMFLTTLPEWTRPRTAVSADAEVLRSFVTSAPGATVLKPARGTRGENVYKLHPGDPNLNVIIESLLPGWVVAQDFVPSARNGDTRVVVLDGEVLELDGEAAAIHRIPHKSDFRSNIHAGGRAEAGVVTEGMRRVVEAAAPHLANLGIRLAGLDFLGDLLCEVNVFSTGGLKDAEIFFDRPFARHAVEALVRES